MTWRLIGGFPPSSYVGNVVNELKAELRAYEADRDTYASKMLELDDGESWGHFQYDEGWHANTRSMIERLEGVADELRFLEG